MATNAIGVNHRTATPDDDRRSTAEWVGLRQSIRRLAAGQGVRWLLQRETSAKAQAWRGTAPAFGRPSLCSAGALTKTGLADCNSMSVCSIAASEIPPDGGNDGLATVAVPKNCIRCWRKGQRVDAMAVDRERCGQLEVQDEIDGFHRGASPVIPVSVGCPKKSERGVVD